MSNENMGRPTVLDEACVNKLLEAFAVGANDTEACAFAGITRPVYYNRRKADEDFVYKIDSMKEKLPLKAKSELAKLLNNGDPSTVKWYLERVRRLEYSTRTELDDTHKFDDNIKITIETD